MTQAIKTFRTERGAKAFAQRIHARFGHLWRVCCTVGLDFRDHWYVEVFVRDKWYPVGPFKRGALH